MPDAPAPAGCAATGRRASPGTPAPGFSRRTLARTAGWAAPAAAVGFSAPAFAASGFTYTMLGSVSTTYRAAEDSSCPGGLRLAELDFSNDVRLARVPAGFAVLEEPRTTGTTSPRTAVTLDRFLVTLYYPAAAINTTASGHVNGFRFTSSSGSANWAGPELGRLKTINGTSWQPFTFRFIGQHDALTSPRLATVRPWPGSDTLIGSFAAKPLCTSARAPFYYAFDRGFRTANGDEFSQQTPIQRVLMEPFD